MKGERGDYSAKDILELEYGDVLGLGSEVVCAYIGDKLGSLRDRVLSQLARR